MNKFKLKYEKSFVAFIDVLGFKNMVYDKSPAGKAKIELYLNDAYEALYVLKKIESKKHIGHILISDSIIFSVPFGDNNQVATNNLRQLVISIYSLQRKLAKNNIWVRGAVSCGQSHFDEKRNQIIGDAYIKAYELEQSSAKYPRVVLDCQIIEELGYGCSADLIQAINLCNSDNPLYAGKVGLFDWQGKVLDKDFPFFIDYLNYLPVEDKKVIADHILRNARNSHLYLKFKWVADYFLSVESCPVVQNKLISI